MVKRPYSYFLQVPGNVGFSRAIGHFVAGGGHHLMQQPVSWRIGDTASEPRHVMSVL